MSNSSDTYRAALGNVLQFYGSADPAVSRRAVADRLVEMLGLTDVTRFPSIYQVTGTNGKGSTVAFLEAALLARGRPVLALTSPHCASVRERIRIDGQPLPKDVFASQVAQILPTLVALRGTPYHPGPTDVIAVMAMRLHRELGRECAGIYEVGCGGRTDATNVFCRSVVGLTTVDDDHLDRFGGTLEAVAVEKLGLCKRGGQLVHQRQSSDVMRVIEAFCAENGIARRSAPVRHHAWASDVGLTGPWQAENFGLAEAMLQASEGTDAAIAPIGTIRHRCRMEVHRIAGKAIWLDGAHNVPAVRRLIEFLAGRPATKRIAIFGVARDKDWRTIAREVATSRLFDVIVCTASTRGQPVEPHALADATAPYSTGFIIERPCLRCALEFALPRDEHEVYVFGSLLLCGDFDRSLHRLGFAEHAIPLDDIDPEQPWMRPLC